MFKRQGININIPDIEHADGSLGQDEAGEHEVGGGEEGDEDRGGVGAHGGGGQQHVPSSASILGITISGCGRTHSVAELMAVPTKEMEAAATPPAHSCPPTSILSLLVSMSHCPSASAPPTQCPVSRRLRVKHSAAAALLISLASIT